MTTTEPARLRDTDPGETGGTAAATAPALLNGQRVDVHLTTGERYTVTTINADRVRFDITRPKHGWPSGEDAPFLWFTFLAWAASRREGRTELSFERFFEQTIACDAIEVDEDVDGVRPTRPGPG